MLFYDYGVLKGSKGGRVGTGFSYLSEHLLSKKKKVIYLNEKKMGKICNLDVKIGLLYFSYIRNS